MSGEYAQPARPHPTEGDARQRGWSERERHQNGCRSTSTQVHASTRPPNAAVSTHMLG